ncbi:MAG: hypothetical protein QN173_08760 [Armatimonadota bacterium]|nr:hypothetical protein [Armatimonadota bacterium]MDR7437010.1 hypothetical protein [Armatimonadota bacterium]MDR7472919.1 hypothetical protein [Armatimonadota bacterium]MDR7507677.1 hypothetical protein [Armatimonadota bacterium]MDR7508896.1 hypothetical protein [Armatimonadota bacterium]
MTDLADRSRWEEAAEALSRYLAGARSAATLVGVASLVHPEMLVEIEVEAAVDDGAAS